LDGNIFPFLNLSLGWDSLRWDNTLFTILGKGLFVKEKASSELVLFNTAELG
jgi:hypothetical protein